MDTFYAGYFVIHFFVTLLVDAAICLPPVLRFRIQDRLLELHLELNNDTLIAERPVWLQAFVWLELIFQAPFFVWAAFRLTRGNRKGCYLACLVYGVEASVTTFACLAEIACDARRDAVTKTRLLAIYLPSFLIPAYMTWDFYGRLKLFVDRKSLKTK